MNSLTTELLTYFQAPTRLRKEHEKRKLFAACRKLMENRIFVHSAAIDIILVRFISYYVIHLKMCCAHKHNTQNQIVKRFSILILFAKLKI